jgi:Lrp/AsnC family transcriptional regulator
MGKNPSLDSIDRSILGELQRDASRSIQQIAEAVGLSQNPCWRRIRRLEAEGVIRARVALVDPRKVDKALTVFVNVRTNQHNQAWLDGFAERVRAIPEVVEFYRMSGEVDYLLKILAADVAEYDAIYKRLIEAAELHDVSSSFAMEQIKFTTVVPLGETR